MVNAGQWLQAYWRLLIAGVSNWIPGISVANHDHDWPVDLCQRWTKLRSTTLYPRLQQSVATCNNHQFLKDNRSDIWCYLHKDSNDFNTNFDPRILSDVAACTATCYNTLARMANEASPYRHRIDEETSVPAIPQWQRPVPPVSALTLKECSAERQAGSGEIQPLGKIMKSPSMVKRCWESSDLVALVEC